MEAVLAAHRAAFARDEEAEMAAAIVESGQFPPELSLAAVVDERIAGHVIEATSALGEPLLLLEGSPAYYGRFGFVRADELGLLPPPEALYDWAFQVAVLDERAELPRGRVVYPRTFVH
jgi:putative acetyltransferase